MSAEHPQSSGERHLEQLMANLDPDSERYRVLASARRFKASWVELGEQLVTVNSRRLYQEWGYADFGDYCSHEVRIRRPTAEKLTMAYRFLERQEPQLLARQEELKPLPDFRSVDLLRQAREERDFSEEEYAELRRSVVDEERSHPTVRKRFQEVAKTRETAPVDPLVPLKGALAAARRLDTALAAVPGLEPAYRELAGDLVTRLQAEVEGLSKQVAVDSP